MTNDSWREDIIQKIESFRDIQEDWNSSPPSEITIQAAIDLVNKFDYYLDNIEIIGYEEGYFDFKNLGPPTSLYVFCKVISLEWIGDNCIFEIEVEENRKTGFYIKTQNG